VSLRILEQTGNRVIPKIPLKLKYCMHTISDRFLIDPRITDLILDPSHSLPSTACCAIHGFLQCPSGTSTYRLPRVRVEEGHQEEWDVVLPWDPAIGSEVDRSDHVPVAIVTIGDQEFSRVHLIMDIPATVLLSDT
jgi:hypothetical protein